ncbi:MAG TPA: glycosyltransferase family 2 protein [Chitinophagaceae bacterium]|nr:glycosyltransferase family 2 protein [Chitinophagaceae bacterium]HAN37270.1 glycosyltransferase family 2 protein [Chitinophagaceae bacterium]
MAYLSVAIITYNEASNIERCIRSVATIADEVLVVDSNSTDNTTAIATALGAKVIVQPFLGYIEQKNFALQQASHPFVLSLDADEALDETLLQSIAAAKQLGFTADAYTMNRSNYFCGSFIKHGTWYPDRKLRLVRKEKAAWGGINPHDKLALTSAGKQQHLQGNILHYTYHTIEELVAQTNKFTTIQAKAMYAQGKRSSVFKMVMNPLVAFISGYIIKRGFLDGINGFIIARSVAYSTLLKYAKLYHLQQAGK